jgi:hypothetical protein
MLEQLNGGSQPQRGPIDPEILEQLNAPPPEVEGVNVMRTRQPSNQTTPSVPAPKGAMRSLPPSRFLSGSDFDTMLFGGSLPMGLEVEKPVSTAPNLTEQQQRLGEFARLARTPVGTERLDAEASHIGAQPKDPYADDIQSGNAIWQLRNKGNYDPNYQLTPSETALDVYNSAQSGLGETTSFLTGLGGMAQQFMPAVSDWTAKISGVSDTDRIKLREKNAAAQAAHPLWTPEETSRSMEKTMPGSTTYRPATTLGRYGNMAGAFIGPGGIASKGNMAAGAVKNILAPAAITQAASDYSKGDPYFTLGAALMSPLAVRGALHGVGNISPAGRIDPARLKAADVLRRAGVRMTGGDISGSKSLRINESELGGRAYSGFREDQAEDITQAVTSTIKNATPTRRLGADELNAMAGSIGREFDDLGRRNIAVPDIRFTNAIGNVWRTYVRNTNPAAHNRVQQVEDYVVEMQSAIKQGQTPASVYQKLRSKLAAQARATKDPTLRAAYDGFRNAVDDMMERSIIATNPADVGRFRQVRKDWKNFMSLQESMSGASEATNLGLVTPAMLQQGVKRVEGRNAVSRNRGDLAELARASNALLRDLPNSNTASRAAARAPWMAGGGGLGLMAPTLLTGQKPEDLQGAAISVGSSGLGILGASLLPWGAGRALMSKTGRRYMSNQMAPWLKQPPGSWKVPLAMGGAGAGLMAAPYMLDIPPEEPQGLRSALKTQRGY